MQNLKEELERLSPQKLAEELCSVQPMPDNLIKDLLEALGNKTWKLYSGNEDGKIS